MAEERYNQGDTDRLNYLELRSAEIESRVDLIEAREALWKAAVSLYSTLGGGWMQNDL